MSNCFPAHCGIHCELFLSGNCEDKVALRSLLDYADEETLKKYNKVKVTYNDTQIRCDGVYLYGRQILTGNIKGRTVILDHGEFVHFWGRAAGVLADPVLEFRKRFLCKLLDGKDIGVRFYGLQGVFVDKFDDAMKGRTIEEVCDALKAAHSEPNGGWFENVEQHLGREAAVLFEYLGIENTGGCIERSLNV